MAVLNPGIQKIDRMVVELEDFQSFSIMGDPGCDGLGAEIMSVFLDILYNARETDFSLVLGDMVPFGSKIFYANASDFINMSAGIPVFMLRGNHDTVFYGDYFGNTDYAIADGRTLIVVLDDAERRVSEKSLELLRYALEKYPRPNIILSMHIPPPNRVSSNSLNPEEWKKITGAFAGCGRGPAYILAGHVHSYFEDTLDGATLVMTGGAGARIEDVPGVPKPYYHWVKMYYDSGASSVMRGRSWFLPGPKAGGRRKFPAPERCFRILLSGNVRPMLNTGFGPRTPGAGVLRTWKNCFWPRRTPNSTMPVIFTIR